MPEVSVSSRRLLPHPIDLLEEIASANEWLCDRASDDELAAEIPGRWSDHRLYFTWCADMSALQFTCVLDVKVPKHRRGAVNELLAVANERLWLGHFEMSSEGGEPAFRHTVPLRGVGGASVEQLEDVVDTALTECDRFYPAFQYVVWGGKDPAEAVSAACLDPVGEA